MSLILKNVWNRSSALTIFKLFNSPKQPLHEYVNNNDNLTSNNKKYKLSQPSYLDNCMDIIQVFLLTSYNFFQDVQLFVFALLIFHAIISYLTDALKVKFITAQCFLQSKKVALKSFEFVENKKCVDQPQKKSCTQRNQLLLTLSFLIYVKWIHQIVCS